MPVLPQRHKMVTDDFLSFTKDSAAAVTTETVGGIDPSLLPRDEMAMHTLNNETSGGRKRKRNQKAPSPPAIEDPGNVGDKSSKGLRHFSWKVCEKVETKKTTTYNEVADELVGELAKGGPVDQKNIRRRVYDALNVLMAMNIIHKDKKDIKWVGLPTNAKQELSTLEEEHRQLKERVKRKKSDLCELITQQIAYRNLLLRNGRERHQSTNNNDGNLTQNNNENPGEQIESRIYLPFIIVNTKQHTVIECEVSDNRGQYFFNFSLPFEIHDDSEILKRMGLHQMDTSQFSDTLSIPLNTPSQQ